MVDIDHTNKFQSPLNKNLRVENSNRNKHNRGTTCTFNINPEATKTYLPLYGIPV